MSIFNKKFPNVEFSSRTDAVIQDGALSLDGILTINGIEKSHSMELTLKNRGQEYSVFGVTAVSMEAYEIAAPGMGPMKVNDLVQLKIDFQIPTADLQK
jgi:polyisoprenoid-binding protein YceI